MDGFEKTPLGIVEASRGVRLSTDERSDHVDVSENEGARFASNLKLSGGRQSDDHDPGALSVADIAECGCRQTCQYDSLSVARVANLLLYA